MAHHLRDAMIRESNDDPASKPDTDVETATARSNLYGLLASVYWAEPTLALLKEIKSPAFKKALKEAGAGLDMDFGDQPDDDQLEALAIEYARLFIGPGGHIAPYAAIYLGGEGASLWGPETAWVKGFIENAGFDYKPDYHDLPDHIAVELEFMQEIIAREARALEKGDAAEAGDLQRIEEEFLTRHLVKWVPEFCRKIEGEAELPFYKKIAILTRDFLVSEIDELQS